MSDIIISLICVFWWTFYLPLLYISSASIWFCFLYIVEHLAIFLDYIFIDIRIFLKSLFGIYYVKILILTRLITLFLLPFLVFYLIRDFTFNHPIRIHAEEQVLPVDSDVNHSWVGFEDYTYSTKYNGRGVLSIHEIPTLTQSNNFLPLNKYRGSNSNWFFYSNQVHPCGSKWAIENLMNNDIHIKYNYASQLPVERGNWDNVLEYALSLIDVELKYAFGANIFNILSTELSHLDDTLDLCAWPSATHNFDGLAYHPVSSLKIVAKGIHYSLIKDYHNWNPAEYQFLHSCWNDLGSKASWFFLSEYI